MVRWTLAAVVVALLAVPALAQPVRCGTEIIGPGDNMERVAEFCGQPTRARNWVETIPAGDDYEGMFDTVQIPMAEWDYDSGPDLFPDKIIFRNGIVQEVRN
jgi:hypothetical protein